jgi:hypothetical protein
MNHQSSYFRIIQKLQTGTEVKLIELTLKFILKNFFSLVKTNSSIDELFNTKNSSQ